VSATQRRRHGLADRVGAEDGLDDFLQHDGEAEGDEYLLGMRALVEMLDQATFHDDADQQHHRNGEEDGKRHRPVDQHGAPIAEPGLGQRRTHFERGAPGRGLGGVDRDGFERDQVAEADGAEGAQHE
jgi:hypothetical protein